MIRSNTYSFARICSFHRKDQASYAGRDDSQHGGGTIVPSIIAGECSLAAAQAMKCSALTSLGCFPIKIISALCTTGRRATVVDVELISLCWITALIYAVLVRPISRSSCRTGQHVNQMSNHNGIRFIKKWLPVLLWAAVIFFFSTEHFSAPQSSRILGPLLHWLFPDIGPEQVSSIQFAVRKLGHWLEYFILAVLLYRALVDESRGKHSLRPAAWTMALALVWAATDEFHQSWVPSRTASIVDVMIDGFGGLFGTFWMYLRHNRTREPASWRNDK